MMSRRQEALPLGERKVARMEVLRGNPASQETLRIMNLNALKEEEERKRNAAYDPVARWQHIQQTITWAEANLPPHLRRNRSRQPRLYGQSRDQ